jgi:siroheme synthase
MASVVTEAGAAIINCQLEANGADFRVLPGGEAPQALSAEAAACLRTAYVAMAFAFQRLHSSARSRDGELCQTLERARGDIERVMKAAGHAL